MKELKPYGKLFMMFFLLCLIPLSISAQDVIKGIVTDTSGEPVVGATVRVSGAQGGSITNLNGAFNLKASSKSTLVISYVGFETQKVDLNGRTNVNIVLKEETGTLNDVVVIGYGTAKRSDISGSVASVDTKEMLRKVPVNVSDGLKGSAPGVLITSQDGAPNSLSQVRIRGVGTINGNSQPLYVVDGVQVGTSADFLNPQDIESIQILKDASATAIYGSRGANGVIMITTKQGKAGAVHVDVSADWSVQTLYKTLDVLDVDTYAKTIRQARANDGSHIDMPVWDEKFDGQRNAIDWQDVMTHNALRQNYNMSLSGGTSQFQGTFSAGYMDNDGLVVNTSYRRMNLRATAKGQPNKYLEIGGELNFTHDVNRGSNVGFNNNTNLSSIRDYATLAPTMDYTDVHGNLLHSYVKNADGTYGTFYQTSASGSEVSTLADNFYARQMELDNPTRNNRLLANAYVDFHPIKGLNVRSILSYNRSSMDGSTWATTVHRYVGGKEVTMNNIDLRRSLSLSQSSTYDKSIETYATYHWSNDIHDLTAMAGNSVSQSKGYWVQASAKDFLAENIRVISLTNDNSTKDGGGGFNLETRFISFYGRLMYSLLGRYNLTATLRRDGSSNFGSGNRWGTFPSTALSWRVSEEPWMKNIKAVDNIKVRLGWGRTGNAGSATSNAVEQLGSASTQYHFYADGASTQNFTIANGMAQLIIANPNLKWETNEQWNAGLDFTLLHNDLGVALDYFVRNSKDLLLDVTVRPSSGYKTYYDNFGEIQNRGFEFSINYNHRFNKDWTFGASITGSTLKNKIKKCGLDIFNSCSSGNDGTNIDGSNVQGVDTEWFGWKNHSICREGYAVGSYYGYRAGGIVRTQEQLDALNKAAGGTYQEGLQVGDIYYLDLDGDNKVNENDETVIGNGFPKLNFGINLTASYKNWDFALYTYGELGQDILSYSAMRLSSMKMGDDPTVANILRSAYDESFTNNPNGSLPRLSLMDNNKNNTRVSDFWIKNGDFWKFSNLQIGYTFSSQWLKPLGINSARAYIAVRNLLCISGYNKYGDPECGQGSVIYTGLDTGRYPTPRTYSFGLTVQF